MRHHSFSCFLSSSSSFFTNMESWSSEPANTISMVVSVKGWKEYSLLPLLHYSILYIQQICVPFWIRYCTCLLLMDCSSWSELLLLELVLGFVRFAGLFCSHQPMAGLNLIIYPVLWRQVTQVALYIYYLANIFKNVGISEGTDWIHPRTVRISCLLVCLENAKLFFICWSAGLTFLIWMLSDT